MMTRIATMAFALAVIAAAAAPMIYAYSQLVA